MKNLLSIFLSLFIFSVSAEGSNCLSEDIFSEKCEKEREEYEKNKKQGYLEEEYIEDKWIVSVFQHEGKDTSDWSIGASVNGKITHGDRLHIRILLKDINSCNYGNTFTSFYTVKDNKNFNSLSKEVIPAFFKNENIKVEILFASKFLRGHSVFIDLGWNRLDGIKQYFLNEKEITLKLLDSDDFKVDNYFDINENSYSLVGLNTALDRAKNECVRIVKQRNNK